MAFKQWHKSEEMVTNDTKMSWKCDRDKKKHKYYSKMLTATWLPPQYTKQQVLKFRLKGLFKQWSVNRWKVQPETLHKGFVPRMLLCVFTNMYFPHAVQ